MFLYCGIVLIRNIPQLYSIETCPSYAYSNSIFDGEFMREVMRHIHEAITSLLSRHPQSWTLKEALIFFAKIILGILIIIIGILAVYGIFCAISALIGATVRIIRGKKGR